MKPSKHRIEMVENDGAGWFIYVAQFGMGEGESVVKIGISETPMYRIATHSGQCPFPITQAWFAPCSNMRGALRLERKSLAIMKEIRLNGEWVRALDEYAPKIVLGISDLARKMLGVELAWKHCIGSVVVAFRRKRMAIRNQAEIAVREARVHVERGCGHGVLVPRHEVIPMNPLSRKARGVLNQVAAMLCGGLAADVRDLAARVTPPKQPRHLSNQMARDPRFQFTPGQGWRLKNA